MKAFPQAIRLRRTLPNLSCGELAGPPMPLLYEERAPYQMRSGESVGGLVGAPSEAAFKSGGVPFRWEASSQNRLLRRLRENQITVCAVSLFKNKERLEHAKYTKPVYRDHPIVALVRPPFAVAAEKTLSDATSPVRSR